MKVDPVHIDGTFHGYSTILSQPAQAQSLATTVLRSFAMVLYQGARIFFFPTPSMLVLLQL